MAKQVHHVCSDCGARMKGVFELPFVVWGSCCWCGESTGGLYKEAENPPCQDTCRSEWLEQAKGQVESQG